MSNLNNVFETLQKRLDSSQDFLNKINLNYNNVIATSNLKLLSDISSNISLLELQLEELYHYMLETNQIEMSAEEQDKLKSYKINNKIQQNMMPYMLLMKLVLENDLNNI
jgi:hypothetical protein